MAKSADMVVEVMTNVSVETGTMRGYGVGGPGVGVFGINPSLVMANWLMSSVPTMVSWGNSVGVAVCTGRGVSSSGASSRESGVSVAVTVAEGVFFRVASFVGVNVGRAVFVMLVEGVVACCNVAKVFGLMVVAARPTMSSSPTMKSVMREYSIFFFTWIIFS